MVFLRKTIKGFALAWKAPAVCAFLLRIETKSIAHSLTNKNFVFVNTVENFVIIQQIGTRFSKKLKVF